jgi:hypothetical protein
MGREVMLYCSSPPPAAWARAAAWLQRLQESPSGSILLSQVALLVLTTDCLLLAGSLLRYSKVEKQRSAMAVGSVPSRGEERVLDVAIDRSSPLPNERIKAPAFQKHSPPS